MTASGSINEELHAIDAPKIWLTRLFQPGTAANQSSANQISPSAAIKSKSLADQAFPNHAFLVGTIPHGKSRLDASGSQNGGAIRHVTGADLTHSGTYRADGAAGNGGNIDIGGGATKLLSPTITANGGANGGQIRIGGEFQGGKGLAVDELPNTQRLAVTTGTTISANGGGSGQGDGGTVILWADENANILGDISARPGADAGEGGVRVDDAIRLDLFLDDREKRC